MSGPEGGGLLTTLRGALSDPLRKTSQLDMLPREQVEDLEATRLQTSHGEVGGAGGQKLS